MAATSAMKPGIGGRRYRNTGTYGSPTWTAQLLDLDVISSLPWDFVEAGSRETRAKLYMKARADMQIQVKSRSDDADTGAVAILAAAMSPTAVLDCLVLNGLITVEGASGFRAEFLVNLTGEPQEADGSIYHTYDLKPTWTANGYPKTVVMGAASAPTMATL
jgi:hypothetical protein